MKQRDIDMIAKIIRASGVGTRIQREAICTLIRDWFVEFKTKKEENAPSR